VNAGGSSEIVRLLVKVLSKVILGGSFGMWNCEEEDCSRLLGLASWNGIEVWKESLKKRVGNRSCADREF
jgi:hypothetical protein